MYKRQAKTLLVFYISAYGATRRMAEEVTARMPLLKRLWTAQVGAPVWVAEAFLSGAAAHFELSADLANTYPFEEERQTARGTAKIIREPVGVCALIVPWNAPLYLLTQKLAAALISGCTVVIKPSPETPLDALVIAECAHAAGFPRGVVNVVPADRGPGDWLVRRPEIDTGSFTGSTPAGKEIRAGSADRGGRGGRRYRDAAPAVASHGRQASGRRARTVPHLRWQT